MDVEVNLDGGAELFRQQLFSLTNVTPENQKGIDNNIDDSFIFLLDYFAPKCLCQSTLFFEEVVHPFDS